MKGLFEPEEIDPKEMKQLAKKLEEERKPWWQKIKSWRCRTPKCQSREFRPHYRSDEHTPFGPASVNREPDCFYCADCSVMFLDPDKYNAEYTRASA